MHITTCENHHWLPFSWFAIVISPFPSYDSNAHYESISPENYSVKLLADSCQFIKKHTPRSLNHHQHIRASLNAPAASLHYHDMLTCVKTAGGLLERKTLAGKYLLYFAVPLSVLHYKAGKSSSQGWQYAINTIFVLISNENTRSCSENSLSRRKRSWVYRFFYDITTRRRSCSCVNKAHNDWEERPCIWKTDVMRPFSGDIFMHGCNFDATSDPSLWQFYK